MSDAGVRIPGTHGIKFRMFLVNDLIPVVTISGVVLGTFGVGEYLRHRARWASERTRKFAHIFCGVVVFTFPYYIQSVHTVGVLSAAFALLLVGTKLLGFMQSIHAVRRKSLGAVYYPIALYGSALLTWDQPALFQASVLLLAFADGLAALVGKAYGRRKYHLGAQVRTIEGSVTVLVVSFITVTLLLGSSGLTGWAQAALIGALAGGLVTAVEALSLWGTDNLLIPMISAVFLREAVSWEASTVYWHTAAACMTLAIALACQLKGYLRLNGAVAAWLLSYVVLGFGGVAWFAPLLAFFLSINWAGKWAERLAERIRGEGLPMDFERVEEKGSRRDYLQIFANGGVCFALAIAHAIHPSSVFFWAFIGSVSAACADTFASELGILSRRRPVLLWTFQPVPTGLSGGITAFGYVAAALGALVPVAVVQAVGSPYPMTAGAFAGALACGLIGSTVDSVVGATLQHKKRCVSCGKVLEKREHCGVETVHHSGRPAITNDVVNMIGAATGAAVGAVLALLA